MNSVEIPTRLDIRETSWLSAAPDFHALQFPAVGPRIPRGFHHSAQGCESASYPGSGRRIRTTLKGLRHGARPRSAMDATPLGLKINLHCAPRVGAERANPGLNDATPLGLSRLRAISATRGGARQRFQSRGTTA